MKNFNFYQLNHIIISNTLTEIKMNEIPHFVSYPSYPNLSYENKSGVRTRQSRNSVDSRKYIITCTISFRGSTEHMISERWYDLTKQV